MSGQQFTVVLDGPVPDSSAGLHWAVKRLDPGRDTSGLPVEVALLETDGPAYLTRKAARHLAGLLLAYAGHGAEEDGR